MTQHFQDSAGRTYRAAVTIRTAARLRELGIDLNRMGEPEFWETVTADPDRLGRALWLLVEKSAVDQGVTADQFVEALEGDAVYAACQAMREAFLSFCQPSVRTALRTLLEKGQAAEQIAVQQMTEQIDRLTPETILTSLRSGSNSPESSE